jgi:hypothetical protein
MITACILGVFRTEDPAKLHNDWMQVIGSQLMLQMKMHCNVLQRHSFTTNSAMMLQHVQQSWVTP